MPKASRFGSSAWSQPVLRCEKWKKKEKLSERSEFFSSHFLLRSAGHPEAAGSRGRLSLLTFFDEAKKVSGCRAAPGNPGLSEERTRSITATRNNKAGRNKKSTTA